MRRRPRAGRGPCAAGASPTGVDGTNCSWGVLVRVHADAGPACGSAGGGTLCFGSDVHEDRPMAGGSNHLRAGTAPGLNARPGHGHGLISMACGPRDATRPHDPDDIRAQNNKNLRNSAASRIPGGTHMFTSNKTTSVIHRRRRPLELAIV